MSKDKKQTITPEFCRNNTLIFLPKDEKDAALIQQKLFKMGFPWADADIANFGFDIVSPGSCVDLGMVLDNGELYLYPSEEDFDRAFLCTSAQLTGDYASKPTAGKKPVQKKPAAKGPLDKAVGKLEKFKESSGIVNAEDFEDEAEPRIVEGKGDGLEDEGILKEAQKGIDNMIGLKQAKIDIKQMIALTRVNQAKKEMGMDVNPASLHMVLTGNPGTGKTTCAREIAKIYHSLGLIDRPEVLEVTRNHMVGAHIGETEEKTTKIINEAEGGILFIDEAYALATDDSKRDFGRKALDTLVAEMENRRESLIVLVAGYPEPMKQLIAANPGLKSRFTNYISFDNYSTKELGEIMDGMLRERGCTMTKEARDMALNLLDEEKLRQEKEDKKEGNLLSFGNGRTVRNLVEQAEKIQAARLDEEGILGKKRGGLDTKAFKKALTTITPADIKKISLEGIANDSEEKPSRSFGFSAALDEPQQQKPAAAKAGMSA